jgi:tetratricopeptide (TPR) repeat protein
MTLLSSLLILALAVPGEGASSAQEEVDQLHTEGLVLYRAGKHRPALAKFEEAYRKFPDPTILFNVAKCLEALGEVDRAIATYRSVSNQPGADADLVNRAKTRMEVLENAKLRSRTEPIADEAPLPPAVAPEEKPAAAVSTEVGGSWMTVGKWTFLGVGAAAAIAGGVLFGLGHGQHAEVQEAIDTTGPSGIASLTQAEAQSLLSAGTEKKNLGYGLMGAGTASVVVSALLFVFDGGEDTTVGIAATADGAGAIVRGRF